MACVNCTIQTAVAVVLNLVFWAVVVILVRKLREFPRWKRMCNCRVSPAKPTSILHGRTPSTAPLHPEENDYEGDWGAWEDDWEDGEPDYENQIIANKNAENYASYNSLRSENLQMDMFNRAYRKPGGGSVKGRESQSYETMPDDLQPPQRAPSVVYHAGKEIVRVNGGRRQDSRLPGVPSLDSTAYENFDAVPPPPTVPPPSTGEPPPPPTTPPPTLAYENLPEDIIAQTKQAGRPPSGYSQSGAVYEDIDGYNKVPDNEDPFDGQAGMRPQSLTYENPEGYADDGPPVPEKRYSMTSDGEGQSRVPSMAYEDPTDYSEATLKKKRQSEARESAAYEEMPEEDEAMRKRRDTMTANL